VENEDGQERTEDPTGKRLEEAYQEGKVPHSREIGSMAILFTGLVCIYHGIQTVLEGTARLMNAIFSNLDRPLNQHSIALLTRDTGTNVGVPMIVFLLLLAVIGGLATFVQIGWHPRNNVFELHLDRLNPLPGLKRLLFSKESLVELAKSMLKLGIVGYIAYDVIDANLERIVLFPRIGLRQALSEMGELLYRFSLRSLMWLSVIAIGDMLFQRYQSWESLKMTKQEVKDEYKNQEGNPQVKGRIRNMGRQWMKQKSGIQNVPKADVIITNPDHYAIALQYSSGRMRAPVVLARGMDRIAEAIKAEGRRCGVPRVENRALARTLYKMTRVGDEIPPDLYTTVAEVLAFVYRLKQGRAS